MGIPTYTIIIGIRRYGSESLSEIPAAECDAIGFSRAMLNWGIARERLHLFLNEDARLEAIQSVFVELSSLDHPFKLVFYFAGHGFRTQPPHPLSYLLLSDSRAGGGSCTGGLCLDELVTSIGQMQCVESYFFIDACSLRINSLKHPLLEGELQRSIQAKKKFFCMLSSGIEESFESIRGNFGYFTKSLLSVFAENKMPSVNLFVEKIREEMSALTLPSPEMYNIESQYIDFFPEPNAELPFEQFQRVFSKSQNQLVLIYGEEGIGKTTFAKELEAESIGVIYLPSLSSTNMETWQGELKERFHLEGISLDDMLVNLDKKLPWALFLIDGLENMREEIEELLEVFSKRFMKGAFFCRSCFKEQLSAPLQKKFSEWAFPPLSIERAKTLLDQHGEGLTDQERELVLLASSQNPMKILKNIDQLPDILECLNAEPTQKAISALLACGLYLNEHLFTELFSISKESLKQLKNLGLITYSSGAWTPLLQLAELSTTPIGDLGTALTYWLRQLDELPDSVISCKALVELLAKMGHQKRAAPYLQTVFSILGNLGEEGALYLEVAATLFIKHSILNEQSLFLASLLARHPRGWKTTKKLLQIPAGKKRWSQRALLLKMHCARREGNWEEIEALSLQSKKRIRAIGWNFPIQLERAIGLFSAGNWKSALAEFELLYRKRPKSPLLTCMLGTLLGFMDSPFESGVQLLEKGISLANESGEKGLRWLSYNNLGELYWQKGNFEKSHYYLEKALSLAVDLKEPNSLVETQRNLLELLASERGVYDPKLEELIKQIDLSSIDPYTMGYICNTLATIYLARKESALSLFYLKKALSVSVRDRNCHIYTLVNLSRHFQQRNFPEKGQAQLSRAISLATSIGNRLSLDWIQSSQLQLVGR